MSRSISTADLPHLAGRFFRSLDPRAPESAEEGWAAARLPPQLLALWLSQRPIDRRHTLAVARRVADGPEWAIAAALLHDVGKIEADLGVPGRVLATVLEPLARRWPGRLGAIGRYAVYTERGAAMLAAVDADPRVAAWAREHHLPPEEWSVPAEWGARLAEADR